MGIWGAFLLGVLFAVAFCPTSAAWFFGLVALILGSEAGAITGLLAKIGVSLPEASLPEAPWFYRSSMASAPLSPCCW